MFDTDWITPARIILENIIHGPGAQFTIASKVGVFEVADILRANRIRYWGLWRLGNGDIAFKVSPGDGRRCGLALAREGVAYVADFSPVRQAHRPAPQRRRGWSLSLSKAAAMLRRLW